MTNTAFAAMLLAMVIATPQQPPLAVSALTQEVIEVPMPEVGASDAGGAVFPTSEGSSEVIRTKSRQGSLSGRVLDGRTLRPLSGVQVHIVELDRGALTGGDGRYRFQDIPAGTYEVEFRRLGYRTVRHTVTVETERTANLEVDLVEQAVRLDELVVTGTVGGTQARAIGNVVSTVDAADVMEVAPVASVQQLLNARTEGVSILPMSGNVGTGAHVRIRGTSSLSLTNQPLIYVDGVRINNTMGTGPNLRSGRQVSRIEDINPEEIERVEIIKGPAAATLYGTEASSGVIQIFTKQGISGDPVFEARVRYGANWLTQPERRYPGVWGRDADTGEVLHANLVQREADAGRPVFTRGDVQNYGVSVRGGTDLVRYYVSGDWGKSQGVVFYNHQRRFSTRANIEIPGETYQLRFNAGHVNVYNSLAQQASGWGIIDQIVWGTVEQLDGRTRGFLRVTPEAIGDIDSSDENARTTLSVNLTHTPRERFSHRVNFGMDRGNEANWTLFPRHPTGTDYFFGGLSLGQKNIQRIRNDYFTFDYGASLTTQATASIQLQTSAGVQYYQRWQELVEASGREFPAPSIETIGGAAVTTSSESVLENKTLGLFIQQEFNYEDRLFLTAAVRGDDNSAFGADFDAAIYPKLSAAWVVSEEPFWNVATIDALRVRMAWGRAGQQPDVFAAVRLYGPGTGPDNVSVLSPEAFGNPDLGPEVGEELELGFDIAVYDERISGAVTYYRQTTRDAIVQRPVMPSLGFPGSQFVNVGEVRNTGLEVSLDSRVVERPGLAWDVGVRLGTNQSEIIDLGGIPPISFGPGQEHREGFPVGSFFARRVVQAELDPDGNPINVLCDGGPESNGQPIACAEAPRVFWGQPHPKYEGALSTEVTIRRNLRLSALAEVRTGHHRFDWDIRFRHLLFLNTEASVLGDEPFLEAYRQLGDVNQSGYMRAGFAKLREVAATYTLPEAWSASIGATRTTLNAAVRNPFTIWTEQRYIFRDRVADPELRNPGAELVGGGHTLFPPLTQLMLTARVTF